MTYSGILLKGEEDLREFALGVAKGAGHDVDDGRERPARVLHLPPA